MIHVVQGDTDGDVAQGDADGDGDIVQDVEDGDEVMLLKAMRMVMVMR